MFQFILVETNINMYIWQQLKNTSETLQRMKKFSIVGEERYKSINY